VAKPKKEEGMEREICTQFLYITELRRRLADLREREKRGEKGLLLLVIDFAGTIFSPTRTTDLIICMQTTQCSQGSSSRPITIWVCVEGYASTLVRIALSL
jgi:hypothetical protein